MKYFEHFSSTAEVSWPRLCSGVERSRTDKKLRPHRVLVERCGFSDITGKLFCQCTDVVVSLRSSSALAVFEEGARALKHKANLLEECARQQLHSNPQSSTVDQFVIDICG